MHARPVSDLDPDAFAEPDANREPHAKPNRGAHAIAHAGATHTDTNCIRDTRGPWSAPRHAGAAVSALGIA